MFPSATIGLNCTDVSFAAIVSVRAPAVSTKLDADTSTVTASAASVRPARVTVQAPSPVADASFSNR